MNNEIFNLPSISNDEIKRLKMSGRRAALQELINQNRICDKTLVQKYDGDSDLMINHESIGEAIDAAVLETIVNLSQNSMPRNPRKFRLSQLFKLKRNQRKKFLPIKKSSLSKEELSGIVYLIKDCQNEEVIQIRKKLIKMYTEMLSNEELKKIAYSGHIPKNPIT